MRNMLSAWVAKETVWARRKHAASEALELGKLVLWTAW